MQDLWVTRVLGLDLGRARAADGAAADGRDADRARTLRELAALWRGARRQAIDNLAGFSSTFLAAQEVQADPRLARVRQVVAGLPDLLAPFDDSLAEALEAAAAGNGGDAAVRMSLTRCQDGLRAAERLAWLEAFAAKATRRAFPVHSVLGQALGEVTQRLE